MNTENSYTDSVQYRILSVLSPVLIIAAVYFGMMLSGGSFARLWASLAFALCFDFVYLFFIETKKDNLINGLASMIVAIAVPAICFFIVYVPFDALLSSVMLAAVSSLCIFIDFGLGMFVLATIAGYTALFLNESLGSVAVILALVLLVSILAGRLSDGLSLLFSILICGALFFILIVSGHGFVLEGAFTFDNIIIAFIAALILILAFFVQKLSSDSESDAKIEETEKSPTNHDNKILKRELGSTQKLNEKLMATNKEAQEKVDSLKQEYVELEGKNRELTKIIEELKNKTVSIEEAIEPSFKYSKDLSGRNANLYKHCLQIAKISSDASELIGCDSQLGYAIGLYHEASKFLGEGFGDKLREKYKIPGYISRQIEHIKDKNNNLPISREAGIVLLCDDIINTTNYLMKNKNESVSMERIVTNTIKVRKDQNVLRLAGFSNEEIQLLKLYFIDKGGSYDTSD